MSMVPLLRQNPYEQYIRTGGPEDMTAYCDKCSQEIYAGDARYQYGGEELCEDCFDGIVRASATPEDMFCFADLEQNRWSFYVWFRLGVRCCDEDRRGELIEMARESFLGQYRSTLSEVRSRALDDLNLYCFESMHEEFFEYWAQKNNFEREVA